MSSSVDPNIWGPHFWFFLMTIAIHYPLNPNSITKKKYYNFIMDLPLFIPDESIGNRFSYILNKYPVSPYIDSRESFIKWTIFIHNKINNEIGKEEMTEEEAMDRYLSEFKEKPVIFSQKMKTTKYWLVIALVICMFLFILYQS